MDDLGIKILTRPATSHSRREGYNGPVRDKVIQEKGWTLDDMVQRPAYQTTFNWPSTSTSHSVLHKFRVPNDLLVNNITSAPFNSFKYWKGSIDVHAQVTATPLHQGCLMMVYVPLTLDATFQTNILPNFSALSVNQTCYMFANTNTSCVMNIPFNTPLNYLDLEDSSPVSTIGALGYIYFIVFNQLQLAATASDTVTVSVFSRMIDNEFKVPRFTPTLFAQSSLQRIRKKVLPTEMIGDVIDKAFSFFGMDKPNNANYQEPQSFRGAGSYNYKEGIEHIDVMDVTPSRVDTVEEDTFATLNDEMSLQDLKVRSSYLGSFTQSTTQLPGTVLASIPINPSPSYILNGVSNQVPLLTYLSLPFNYWRGGLTYKIQVISTSFQTAKVFFAINFGQYQASTTIPLSQVTSQYGEAFEINQGSNEFTFTVPYVSKSHSLYVPNSNVPSEIDSLGTINIVVLNSLVAPNNTPLQITYNVFMSAASDFELSTLSLMNNVAATFVGPSALFAQSAVQPLNTDEANTYKESDNLVAPNTTVMHRDRIATAPVSSIRDYLNKYQLMYRQPFQLHTDANPTVPNPIPVSISIIDPMSLISPVNMSTLPNPGLLLKPVHGLFSHFSPLFRQYKGGLKFKIVMEQAPTNLTYAAYYVPKYNFLGISSFAGLLDYIDANIAPDYNNGTSQGLPSGLYNAQSIMTRLPISIANSIQKTVEFQIPFNSLYKSLLTQNPTAEPYLSSFSDLSSLGYVIFIGYPTTTILESEYSGLMNSYIDIFVSLSDDSRYGTLYQVPCVTPQLTVNSAGTSGSTIYPDSFLPPTNPNNTLTRL